MRVIESRDGFPGPEVWLLARRSVRDPTELAYYFALAPTTVSLQQLARVAGTRYTVEQVIKQAKSEVGFDRYEVRSWHSWYRHLTLAMLAQVWVADQRLVAGENKGGPGGSDRARRSRTSGACWKWPCPCLSGASANAWRGRIGAAASATRRASATTAIAPGPSTLAPIHSIPHDLSTVVILVSVVEVARMLSIGRTVAWELVRKQKIKSVKIGRTRRVPIAAIQEYVERLTDEDAA